VREAADPWDARSLEWLTPNPTPHHNFDEIPTVTHQTSSGTASTPRTTAAARGDRLVGRGDPAGDADPHLPNPSYWPITIAIGLPIIAYGVIFNLALAFVGGAIVLTGIYGWVLEPSMEGGSPRPRRRSRRARPEPVRAGAGRGARGRDGSVEAAPACRGRSRGGPHWLRR
jgi:hypothetical protein